jgi:hypothetical protein
MKPQMYLEENVCVCSIWAMIPCSLIGECQRFDRICSLHLQGRSEHHIPKNNHVNLRTQNYVSAHRNQHLLTNQILVYT